MHIKQFGGDARHTSKNSVNSSRAEGEVSLTR